MIPWHTNLLPQERNQTQLELCFQKRANNVFEQTALM
jgi:hypothetical protein